MPLVHWIQGGSPQVNNAAEPADSADHINDIALNLNDLNDISIFSLYETLLCKRLAAPASRLAA